MTRVAVIAGSGALPSVIVDSLTDNPNTHYKLTGVISIGQPAENISQGVTNRTVQFTQLGTLWKQLKQWDAEAVVFAGGVAERPEFPLAKIDLSTLKSLPKILASIIGNDDHVLRAVADIFQDHGFSVVGLADIAPQITCGVGKLSRTKLKTTQLNDLEDAFRIAKGLGALDVGQAAVIEKGRAIAVEAAEGTDGMLARVKKLRASGRLSNKGGGVLVKCAKPMQDLRFDLPTVGVDTLQNVAEAKLSAIGLEEGRSIILDQGEFYDQAQSLGIGLYGFANSRSRYDK